jgi:ankyrin repeat protein
MISRPWLRHLNAQALSISDLHVGSSNYKIYHTVQYISYSTTMVDLEVVQSALLSAARTVCPSVADESIAARPAEIRRPVRKNSPDIICTAPCLAWALLSASAKCSVARPPAEVAGVHRLKTGGIRITTSSPAGIPLEADFCSPKELADAWLAVCEELLTASACYYGSTRTGEILLTSKAMLTDQTSAGNLLCSACGHFFSGGRGAGLKRHAQIAHGASLSLANEAREAACSAIIVAPTVAPPSAQLGDAESPVPAGRSQLASQSKSVTSPTHAASTVSSPVLHPFLQAAKDGRVEQLRSLVACFGSSTHCLNVRDARGSNALHYAAGSGCEAAVRFLVEELGFDVNAPQRCDRRTAVHWSARNGHLRVLQWLVSDAGSLADVATADGTTPFHLAAWQGHLHVLKWLADYGHVNVYAVNKYRCNAAHWGVMGGHLDVVQWLAARGHDMFMINSNRHSLLHKAAQRGHATVAVWLLGGADGLALKDLDIPSDWETEGGGRLASPLGAPYVQADSEGYTPSAQATACGFPELASLLRAVEDRFRCDISVDAEREARGVVDG